MKRELQRSLLACAMLLIAAAAPACAQTPTSSSTLTVSMTVEPTISVEFVNQGTGQGYCQLSGAGTSAAALNLGVASSSSDSQSCVIFNPGSGGAYSVATNFYIEVNQSNLNDASNGSSLQVSLGSAPPTGVTWQITEIAGNLSTTPVSYQGTVPYGTATDLYLLINVASTAPTGNISNTLQFLATSK